MNSDKTCFIPNHSVIRIKQDESKIAQLNICSGLEDNGKHGSLLVKLSTEKQKWTILSRAKRLKNSTGQMGKVYKNSDMSKVERASARLETMN